MKFLRRVGALVLGWLVLASPVSAATEHLVLKDQNLTVIGAKYDVSPQEICQFNTLSNCNKIRAGQTLIIPSKDGESQQRPEPKPEKTLPPSETDLAQEESVPVPAPVNALHSGLVRMWKYVGADPVLKSWVRKAWLASEEVTLDPRQEAKLRAQGLGDAHIAEVKQRLKEKKFILVFRPKGYSWKSMAFGSGIWGETRNATGDDIPVFAIDSLSDGTQVDLALGCGNTGINMEVVPEKPKPVTSQVAEKRLACEKVGAFWAQLSEHGVSGTARFACLFQVSEKWKAGPTIGLGGSRFDDHTWIELQNFIGGGFEVRGKNIAGFDAVEFVVMVGYGSSEGHSTDGLVEKLKSSGFDAQLAMQLRKQLNIDKKTSITVRLMPFVNVPLSGKEADILWKGMVVKQENGRHLTVGAVLRFEFQRKGLGFKPEITFGIWRMSDVDNPIGWKFLIGASTLDNVWRVGAGLQFPGPIWLVEVEWNPAWGWLQLNAKVAIEALQNGATPTRDVLFGEKAKTAKKAERLALRVIPSNQDSAQPVVKTKAIVPPECRQGWKDSTCFPQAPAANDSSFSIKAKVAETSRPAVNDSSSLAVSGWNG